MKHLLLVTLLCPFLASAADALKPLDVKLGLWESTTTSQASGMPPYPKEAMAKLTPEQRARIEAAMKAEQAKGPQSHTTKSCLTAEQLKSMMGFGDDEKMSCKRTVLRSNSRFQDLQFNCGQGGVAMNGEMHIEAADSGNVKGTAQFNSAGGGNTMVGKMTFTAHWLGTDCGSLKK
jgi:hypothetical protein